MERQSDTIHADIDTQLGSHIADLNLDIFVELMSNLGLVDQMPPLPECVKRAFICHSRGATSILTPSLVTPPGEESLEEADRLLCIREPGQTFHRIAFCAFTEPRTISEPSDVSGMLQ